MTDCCELGPVHERHRRTLELALWINAVMFVVEVVASVVGRSTALLSDSMDMLGDAMVYGLSLYAVGRGTRWQHRAALVKGLVMVGFALGVLVQAGLRVAEGVTPRPAIMSAIGVLALAANATVVLALRPVRGDDLNMRSVWLCSRNDLVANVGVLLAAGAVALTRSAWPDVAVGVGIAALFGTSAARVIRAATADPGSRRLPEAGA